MIEPKDIKKIVIVESLNSAYCLSDIDKGTSVLLTTDIGQHNQIYYSSNIYQGGNLYDDWYEVDLELVDDEINYEPIIKALGIKKEDLSPCLLPLKYEGNLYDDWVES